MPRSAGQARYGPQLARSSSHEIIGPSGSRPRLQARRDHQLLRSAHAYVAVNTLHFYEWLAEAPAANIPEGPPVWICGDRHLGDGGPRGWQWQRVYPDCDLDQAFIGNPGLDVI